MTIAEIYNRIQPLLFDMGIDYDVELMYWDAPNKKLRKLLSWEDSSSDLLIITLEDGFCAGIASMAKRDVHLTVNPRHGVTVYRTDGSRVGNYDTYIKLKNLEKLADRI